MPAGSNLGVRSIKVTDITRHDTGKTSIEEEIECACHFACGSKKKTYPVSCLQPLATPGCALAFLASAGFLQGFIVIGLINNVLSTVEKRFGLNSSSAGFILSTYNISSCIVIPLVSYIGGRGVKPKWIGIGMGMMGLGCLVFSSAHFMASRYTLNHLDTSMHLCSQNQSYYSEETDLSNFKYLFIFAQILNGFGVSPLITLGLSYLDENVTQETSSIYHGIFFAIASAIGPAAGFLVGGSTLRIFTNIGERPNIVPENPLWVGAWWIGFVACGFLLLLICVPIQLFPRYLPNTAGVRRDRSKEMHFNSLAVFAESSQDFGENLSDLPKSILVLFRNPAFMLVAIANALDFGSIAGFSAFMPKYMESMFGLTPTQSAYYLGIVIVFGGGLGYMCGGLLVSKAKLTVKEMIRMCTCSTVAALACSFIYLYTCPNIKFAGVTLPYELNSSSLYSVDYDNQCNEDCQCDSNLYDPVCGSNDVTYLTPCHAGCTTYLDQTYSNCSCIFNRNYMLKTATHGICLNKDCGRLIAFVFGIFGLLFFSILCWTPVFQAIAYSFRRYLVHYTARTDSFPEATLIVIRVVPFKQRSFALGTTWLFNRCFGGIPVPILFGKVYDLTCAVWSGDDEGEGSCRIYYVETTSKYLLGIVLAQKAVILLLYFLSGFFYRPPPKKSSPKVESISKETPSISHNTSSVRTVSSVKTISHNADSVKSNS